MIEKLFALLSDVLLQTSYVEKKNAFPRPLSKEDEQILIAKIKNGDLDARDDLIHHNMRLVVHVVKKYGNYHDTDELISVGSIGLIKAVNTFVKGKGTQFATYAARCIENEILMTLRSNKKYKGNKSLYEPVSFDKEGNEIALIDLISTDEDSVMKTVEDAVLRERLMAIIKKVLDKREREIVILRYGLSGEENYTQIEVAKKFQISRSYVSRIEKKALNKLKQYMIDNNLVE